MPLPAPSVRVAGGAVRGAEATALQIHRANEAERADAAESARRLAEADHDALATLDETALRELEDRLRAATDRVRRAQDERREREREQRLCVVCLEVPKSLAPPCGHLCLCAACGAGGSAPATCPICRAAVPAGGWRALFL